jgi:hypothetical protein
MDFNPDRGVFRTSANNFEASYEDNEPTLLLRIISLHYSNKPRSKFEEDSLKF